MIIGAILEISAFGSGGSDANQNGSALISFYTMEQAIQWATIQSNAVTYGGSGNTVLTLTTIVNTNTGQKRWWYGGTEYTG